MELSDWKFVEPVNKGWSSDRKYRVAGEDGVVRLLRLADPARYEEKRKEYEIIQKYARLGFPMSQPLDFGLCGEGVYMLLSWVEGEDLESVLPTLPEAEQYRLGREAGRILKAIHSIPLDPDDVPTTTKREKKLRQLARYEASSLRYPGDEDAIRFEKESIGLIWSEPPVYQHGDFHPGNLILCPDGSLGVIDFNRWEIGDPWEEFYKLQSFGRELSVSYCVGELEAYFGGEPTETFWKALKVYVAHAALYSIVWAEPFGQEEIDGMVRRCAEAFADYDGFRLTVPIWYTEWKQNHIDNTP